MSDLSDKNIYRFGEFTVDTREFVVSKNGEAVTLTPRAFDVLILLLRNSGHVVEKRQLFDEVWKDNFVSDNALTKVVRELRHALADSANDPKLIETVPKRGYRFIGEIDSPNGRASVFVEAPPPAGVARSGRTSSRTAVIALGGILVSAIGTILFLTYGDRTGVTTPSTIAVLPFKPLDSTSRDESLELGMAETLITRMSNLHDVVVRPMASVRKYNDTAQDPIKAGEELQANAVLDGSIQKADGRIRVSVRLIDVRTGAALWSEQFDESFTDIFRVQDSIAQRIATVLALRLTRSEQEQLAKHMTENPEAYELYLKGQFHWHRRAEGWIYQSLNAYKQALEKDPNFALAHIGVADANIMLSGHRHITMQEAEANAQPSIERALQIDNSLAMAHNALAELKYQYQYDWRGAEAEFRTAVDLNPNVAWIRQAYGWFLMSEGRFDEANSEMERARQLDPSSLTLAMARGRLLYYSRQYDRAIEYYQDLLTLDVKGGGTRLILMDLYERKGMHREAFEIYIQLRQENGMSAEDVKVLRQEFESGGHTAVLRALLERLDKAAAQGQNVSPSTYADIYTSLGDKEKAFYWLEKVFEMRDVSILQFKIEPANDVLRDDPRYAELLRKIGQVP